MVITRETIANPPMPLAGPQNLRELGGYPTITGGLTARGRLLRSDALNHLTPGDRAALHRYGVCCVVDLRTAAERQACPDRLDDSPALCRHHCPMPDRLPAQGGGFRDPDTLAELYVALLDGAKASFLGAMRAIAQAGAGCALFHCAAGKDRTGLVAMLLLALAGVPDEVIVGDYCSSCDNMAVIFAEQKLERHAGGVPVNEALYRSSRVDIEAALEHLYRRYGDAEGYLRGIGCTQRELDALRARLLGGDAPCAAV